MAAPAALPVAESPFVEESFLKAREELSRDPMSGETTWQPFVTLKSGQTDVQVFRRPSAVNPNLYEYVTRGVIEAQPRTFVEVIMDLEYRKRWDEWCKQYHRIAAAADPAVGGHLVYCEYKFPSPLSNRDYVFWMTSRWLDDTTAVILESSVAATPLMPEQKKLVRVVDFRLNMLVRPGPAAGLTTLSVLTQDDPRGSIPSMLVNWAAKTAVPKFITTVQEACAKYRA